MKDKDTELAIAQSEASELRAEFLKLKRLVIVTEVHGIVIMVVIDPNLLKLIQENLTASSLPRSRF